MSTLSPTQFSQLVLNWFDQHGRKQLPWQQAVDAYRVWISEIMLQQTQVATVIPYFQRFMQRFPNIESLAVAGIDEVLHHWSGLGYYSRARNLHRAAQMIMQDYSGAMPADLTSLQALPGIGRSTAGAIMALGFRQWAPILDGNVKRVLSRFDTVAGPRNSQTVLKHLWQLAETYTPRKRTADYTQAMMDLGALICVRSKPRCDICPLAEHCLAHLTGTQKDFPSPKPKRDLPIKQINMLLIYNQYSAVILEKRPPVGIWGGLWGLPECQDERDIERVYQSYGISKISQIQQLPSFRHTFSHFHLDITPWQIRANQWRTAVRESDDVVWYKLEETELRGLAAPVKRLLNELNTQIKEQK